jgi:hypothetical protein
MFLPVFHWLIGGTRILKAKGNSVDTATANLYRTRISFGGNQNNTVRVGTGTDIQNASIQFKGQHNTLIVGKNCYLNGLTLIFEGDHNRIENHFAFHGCFPFCFQGIKQNKTGAAQRPRLPYMTSISKRIDR